MYLMGGDGVMIMGVTEMSERRGSGNVHIP